MKKYFVFIIAINNQAYQYMSDDLHWGLFNDLSSCYEPSVKIQLICQRLFACQFAAI